MYIYIHIPFCTNICNYCDFPKLLYTPKFSSKYLVALEKEIRTRYNNEPVKSIFIGGGTPTSLTENELEQLLELTKIFNISSKIEFTIESNVESLTSKKVEILKRFGVNRVSLGVQTFDSKNLKVLNRHHSKEDTFKAVSLLKQSGINNISIDLIYGIDSNIEIVKKDIDLFLNLDIPHISCYSLIIEDNTMFKLDNRKYIDEDIEYEMYKYIENNLSKNNYIHYEISNYAKAGYESLHNLNYWHNGPYYGFGLGAVSYLNNKRIVNTKNLIKYLKYNYLESSTYEDIKTRMSNTIILSLRTIKGLNLKEFKKTFKKNLEDVYDIKKLLKEGKLTIKNNYLFIPSKYFYLSNEIMLYFV